MKKTQIVWILQSTDKRGVFHVGRPYSKETTWGCDAMRFDSAKCAWDYIRIKDIWGKWEPVECKITYDDGRVDWYVEDKPKRKDINVVPGISTTTGSEEYHPAPLNDQFEDFPVYSYTVPRTPEYIDLHFNVDATGAHVEVPIKVNAWVDQGIAPLVEALNMFPDVVTLDSCEGHAKEGYVYFTHNDGSKKLVDFVSRLATDISESTLDKDIEYKIKLEWAYGGWNPMAKITVKKEDIQEVAKAVKAIATEYIMLKVKEELHKKAYLKAQLDLIHGLLSVKK